MTSRYSRRPESARHDLRQGQDKEGLSRRHLRRKRPHTAIRTEYLGVSSAAFAPPLRRYLESPQHGRRALRSTTPSSTTPSMQSPPGSSGYFVEACVAATSVGHGGRPISTDNRERDRRETFYRHDNPALCSTGLTDERNAALVDTVEAENLHDAAEPRVQQPPGRCPPPGLLTPVGPDWWETAPDNQATSEHPSPLAGGNDDCDSDNGIDQQLLARNEEQHSSKTAVDRGNESGSHPSSQQESSQSSACSEDRCEPTKRDNRYPARSAVRGGHRRRRLRRSSAWDLLTGRRMERGRRKGSRGIKNSDVSSIKSQRPILETCQLSPRPTRRWSDRNDTV